jgi:hypothetical protein
MNRVKRRPIHIPASGSAWAAALVIIAGLPVLAHATEGGVGRPITGMQVTPHFTQTDHIALSVQMYAPTGAYNVNRLANAGQNTWTLTPTIAYTHLFEHNVELSVNYGVEFYTVNNETHYKNAPVSVLDMTALKRFESGWGIGGWSAGSSRSATTVADSPI